VLRVVKIHTILFIILVLVSQTIAQNQVSKNSYQLLRGNSFVASKNYYFLTLVNTIPEVCKQLASDTTLQRIQLLRKNNFKKALDNCKLDVTCLTAQLQFNEDEISQVGQRLRQLYAKDNYLGKLIRNHIIPSGTYYQLNQLEEKELLVKAWEQDARGINFCIGVYAEGKKPNYPLIDSISFKVYDSKGGVQPGYWSMIYNLCSVIYQEGENDQRFYTYSLAAATYLLEINEREQAADFEPMELGENKAAFNKVKSIRWNDYPYSVIVIPGAGPDDPKVPLSAEGMIRCRLAAIQYKKGLAPFIIPSGGKVHPYKTTYNEALEMKRFMMDKLQIPESAIIIDPHARHTTTNIRNSVRLMFRYGIPFEKVGLVCTTRGQSNMVTTTLLDRCFRELKLVPYKNGKRLSETVSEFYPLKDALHINPFEPIDP
jgi:hypothetical protein